MPTELGLRKTKISTFDIVVVPNGDGGKTRRFRASPIKVWLVGGMVAVSGVAFTLALLMFTPLALYIPIPNPDLERKYGREIAETQARLNSLAEDVLLLKDYNQQLRKALGDRGERDTSAIVYSSPEDATRAWAPAPRDTQAVLRDEAIFHHESAGDFESFPGGTFALNRETFRAAFPLVAPTEGFLTQGFDPSRKHYGVDYATKLGTPVSAATDGYVVFAGWTYDDGNMLIVSHGGGYLTVYKHNQSLLKTVNAYVRRSEVIALVGTSGKTSMGPHLHFEVWKDGVPLNPVEFLLSPTSLH